MLSWAARPTTPRRSSSPLKRRASVSLDAELDNDDVDMISLSLPEDVDDPVGDQQRPDGREGTSRSADAIMDLPLKNGT